MLAERVKLNVKKAFIKYLIKFLKAFQFEIFKVFEDFQGNIIIEAVGEKFGIEVSIVKKSYILESTNVMCPDCRISQDDINEPCSMCGRDLVYDKKIERSLCE